MFMDFSGTGLDIKWSFITWLAVISMFSVSERTGKKLINDDW
jgi:hypothetical protein